MKSAKNTKNKVLIVDDTPENLRVLGEILGNDGHEVRVAINGSQGLEIAKSAGVDLILLDVMMPDMTGYEVCAALKKDPRTREIPVIFLTALDSSEDEAKGLTLGAVDYITKPFKVELVRTRIANQLALHNARLELRRHNEELDQLVAERSRDLAEAHKQLKNVDAAKYEFLQLIYHKLWGTDTGFVSLASQSWVLIDPSHPDRAGAQDRYEAAQRDLFDTMRNALMMTAAGKPVGQGTTWSELAPVVRQRGLIKASPRSVTFQEGASPGPIRLRGDRNLLVQALGALAQASGLLAAPGAVVNESWPSKSGALAFLWQGEGALESGYQWPALVQPEAGLHPSSVGLALGLDLPLAVRILIALGGQVTLVERSGGWELRATVPTAE